MNILQKAIEQSEYNFKSVQDFEISQSGDRIDISYINDMGSVVPDFIIVRTDTTPEDVLQFIESCFEEAKKAEKYLLSLAFN